MIVVTTDFITGKEIETIGIVQGNMVQSKHIGKDIGAGFKTIVGGELKGYTDMMTEARDMAKDRMLQQAHALGADGVVGVRYASAAIMQGAAEVIAYGTAVKFI
ncbi:MAG: YbjQ family protein [Eubacteriales bacterium]|nr:YbjQ family protein [Eubacteriales bacterium]MDY3332719.1 YbjQ family protein [Gallibacter sp.]